MDFSATHIAIQENVLLSGLSTFGIGGKADYFVEAYSQSDLEDALIFAREKKIPVLAIGRGSNCLFADEGFRGIVIRVKLEDLIKDGKGLYQVGSGFSFAQLGRISAQDGFHGLEFAAGIPATTGGAIFMNAGASGQETKDYLVSVDALDETGKKYHFSKEGLEFSYRYSSFQKNKMIIISATFQLVPSKGAKEQQKRLVEYRLQTQPYKDKSCGCIFKNPGPNVSSGRLIEESGLKGYTVGGVEVSYQHANFIVNKGSGTSRDVQGLIHRVQQEVLKKTGYLLHSEIRIFDQYGNIQ